MSTVLSVRLSREDDKRLKALARQLDIGPSVLARMVLHLGLASLDEKELTGCRFPLSLLSDLLAPAARAKGLTEKDVHDSVKAARKKLWKEHYAKSG